MINRRDIFKIAAAIGVKLNLPFSPADASPEKVISLPGAPIESPLPYGFREEAVGPLSFHRTTGPAESLVLRHDCVAEKLSA